MNILKYIFVILFSIAGKSLLAQEVQKTPSGEFLIVQLDGSYETYNPKNKAHFDLMKKYKEQQKKLKTKETEKSKTTAKAKETPSKSSADNRAEKKKIEGYFKVLEEEKTKGQLAEKSKRNRELTESQLNELKALTKKKDNQDVQKLTKSLAEAKKEESKAMSALKSANKDAKKAREELLKLNVDHSLYPPYKIAEEAPKVEVKPENKEKIAAKAQKKPAPTKKETKVTPKKESIPQNAVVLKEVNLEKPTRKIKQLSAAEDVMITPPSPSCKIAFDGIDEFSGKRRKETETLPLFQFTDETMKKYYEGEDFMSCEANISALESGYKYITFIFTFASDNVEASYGWLEKDNQLIIKFLDGKILTLYNTRTDRGTVDNVNRKTTYKAICTIGSGEEKALLKGEVDALRVLWSTGTEDYEIFDVDFFANQLKCINK